MTPGTGFLTQERAISGENTLQYFPANPYYMLMSREFNF